MIKTNSGRRLRICDRFTNVVLNLSQKLERPNQIHSSRRHRAERARASPSEPERVRASRPVSSPVSAICKPQSRNPQSVTPTLIRPIRHSANLPFPIPTEPSPHRANPPPPHRPDLLLLPCPVLHPGLSPLPFSSSPEKKLPTLTPHFPPPLPAHL